MEPDIFFDLENRKKVNSTVYWNQILVGPLREFWEDSFSEIQEQVVMNDNAPVRKKVYILVRQELGMRCQQHPPNSPDLNPIENIWAYMKHKSSKKYGQITSVKVVQWAVLCLWNEFEDHMRNHLIESMPNRIQVVIEANSVLLHIRIKIDRKLLVE